MLSNAIKYTQNGEVRAEALYDSKNEAIQISIIDTGVGIEEDKLSTLFSAFTKVNRYRNLNKEGVGLGLVICKNLTEALGGKISVNTKLGEGSTFILTFPLNQNFSISPKSLKEDSMIE